MKQDPKANPTRIAQVNKFIAPLGVELIKNHVGGQYFYFLSVATGAQVGESVMVHHLTQLTLERWHGQAQWAWAAQFRDIYGIGIHDAASILTELKNDVPLMNALCKGAESMNVTPQVLWQTIKPMFRP